MVGELIGRDWDHMHGRDSGPAIGARKGALAAQQLIMCTAQGAACFLQLVRGRWRNMSKSRQVRIGLESERVQGLCHRRPASRRHTLPRPWCA